MFELPEDLGDPDQLDGEGNNTIEDDMAMQARVNAQIAAALGLDDEYDTEPPSPIEGLQHNANSGAQKTSAASVDGKNDTDEEKGYEFNLFSTAGPGGSAGPAKVVLEDESKSLGDGAFVRPRPLSYYTSKGAVSMKEKEQYGYAAVTADTIVQWSRQPSWGMAMPWKVVSISATRKAKPGDKPAQILVQNTDEIVKRKRPGKKQRILLRQRKKTKAQAAEEAAKKNTEKEEHLKDKKKRLNRIKKLRKRAKDKEKKLAAGGGDPDAVNTASESDSDE
ncbi:hypothetical protein IF2G_02005 [Cordyceps javanica]|nr:hypothetical protein IF2G_02005 [Cordyceps javanica]